MPVGPASIITGASRLALRLQQESQLLACAHEQARQERERRVLEATIANPRTGLG